MRNIRYIPGNNIQQTYSLYKAANNGLEVGEKGRMMNRINFRINVLENTFGIPQKLVDSFFESYKHDIGPFAFDDLSINRTYLFDTKIKICPECIKDLKVPTYQGLRCFNRCLEHDLPLVSACPRCGNAFERRNTPPYRICCRKCSYNYGEDLTASDIIFLSKTATCFSALKEKPADDLAAWIIPNNTHPGEYKEIEAVSRFLSNYFLTGLRGKPDRRLYKNDINNNISFDAKKRAEERLTRKMLNYEGGSDEFITLGTMLNMSKGSFRLMPPYTYQNVTNLNYNVPRLRMKASYDEISESLSNVMEDMYEDAYYEVLLPVVREIGYEFGSYKNIVELYPGLRYTFIVFEVKEAYEIYSFFEKFDNNIPNNKRLFDFYYTAENILKLYSPY